MSNVNKYSQKERRRRKKKNKKKILKFLKEFSLDVATVTISTLIVDVIEKILF